MNNLELLQVYNFNKKIRCGSNSDGGYVLAELDGEYDCYISAGISDEESFSRDFINKYNMNEYNSFGFDGTILNYPYNYTNKISFIKKNINYFNDDNNSNLFYLINKYNNIFLKMDIEGGEYPWLLQIDETQLNKFKQIVIEFHGITNNDWGCNYNDKVKCLTKLAKTHYIVHAHGNNYGLVVNNIPDVIELTYINKNYFNSIPELNMQSFPIANLDFSNNINLNDINLNFYPFVNTNISKLYNTYNTKYGLITLYKNEAFIINDFNNGSYWDINTLLKMREYIDPNRNILEIGGHCGTSSIVYSSFLNNEKKLYVYEPQCNMYNLLLKNINQNNLQNKIIPNNLGVFCFEGNGKMNNIDLDGGGGIVSKRYTDENNLQCNFGGIGLGNDGEDINLTTIDNMKLDNIGYIHCDAQGSVNFIFSKGIETITKYRPVILYENKELYGIYLYDNVCKSYPNYTENSKFDIKKYCMEQLNYSYFIDKFNGGIDTLLIP